MRGSLSRRPLTSLLLLLGCIFAQESRKTTADFAAFFVDFALQKRVGVFDGQVWEDAAVAQLRECIADNKGSDVVRWLKHCNQDHVSAWRVPAFAMNNYFVRMPSDVVFEESEDGVDYRGDWPASRLVDAEQTTGVNSCPDRLQGVLSVQAGSGAVRIFEPGVSSQFQSQDEEPTEGYVEMIATPGSVVYIPPGHAYSVRASDDADAVFTEFCVLDAANLNDFRAAIATAADATSYTRSIQELFATGAQLDLQMDKDATESSFARYNVWPRPVAVAEEQDEESQHQHAPAAGGRNRRDKRSFRGWQERARWEAITTGLTLPLLDAPTVVGVERKAVHLEWLSNYKPRNDDSTPAGYEVTIEAQSGEIALPVARLLLQDLIETPDITRSAQERQPVYKYRAKVQGLDPTTTYTFRIALFYDEASGALSPASASATTLPLTPPIGAATNITIDKETVGLTSVALTFNPPDDGGLPILGYHTYGQRQDDTTSSEWAYIGDFNITTRSWSASKEGGQKTLRVTNLLPDTTYRLKLVAFNELGDSTEPALSLPFKTKKGERNNQAQDTVSDHIKGVGHADRAHSDRTYSPTSLVITLNDKAQQIVAGNQTLEVWTAHWSPRSFQVSAETVWVDPPLVDSAISNVNEIRGRIALVRRGGVPFVVKAMAVQAAGGLGVIVLDDGRCKAYDQACLPGAQKQKLELFARLDLQKPWQALKIPVVFAMQSVGENLIAHAQVLEPEVHDRRTSPHDEL